MAGLEHIAKRAGVPLDSVRNVFNAVRDILATDERVQVNGFGTLSPRIEEPRTIKSPVLSGKGNASADGTVTTPRRRGVKFRLAKELRDEWVIPDKPAKKAAKPAKEGAKAKGEEPAKPAKGKGKAKNDNGASASAE